MENAHVVLAGGSGFLGRALAAELLGRGRRVTVLTRGQPPDVPRRALQRSHGMRAPWGRGRRPWKARRPW